MTAEIAVLNKEAVALAADSTVTISGRKAYHTINKLFALSQYQPVGIMIYGSAEIGGVPWETLIKLFRAHLCNTKYDTLVEYKSKFIEFISSEIHDFDENEPKEHLIEFAEDYLELLADEIDTKVEKYLEVNERIEDKKISGILRQVVKSHHEKWKNKKELPIFSKKLIETIKKEYEKNIEEVVTLRLENHKISKLYLGKIVETCFKVYFSKSLVTSGLVFSGFGEKEIFPCAVSCNIESVIFNTVKYEENISKIENKPGKDALIIPYAQTDVVATFMEGISQKMIRTVLDELSDKLTKYSSILNDKMIEKGINQNDVDDIMGQLDGQKILSELLLRIGRVQREYHIHPVIQAVRYLPKNEMAEVAESLVSITSFRQKISLEQESVGGAIDVAVISKTDGFIWIKRKHYFDPKLNPTYMRKYFGESCGEQQL